MSMNEEAAVKEEIRHYIARTFPRGKEQIGDGESLFESGILDSLGFLQMLGFLGKRYKVTFPVTQISMENFDTIDKIAGNVIRRRKTAP